MDRKCKTLAIASLMIMTAFSICCIVDFNESDGDSNYDFIKDDLKYKINSDNVTVSVVGYTTEPYKLTFDTVTYQSTTYTVTVIGASAFENCTSLMQINLSNSVKVISSQAFAGCESIITVSLPDSVSVATKAFAGCSGIRNVTVPPTVTNIVGDAFEGCSFYETNGYTQITDMSKLSGHKYHGESSTKLVKTKEFHIQYDEDGGSVHIQDYWTADSSVRVADYKGVKADFIFAGWDDGLRIYSPRDIYTVTTNVEFVAVWDPVPVYTISFDLNGGTGITPLSFTKKEGESFNIPSCTASKAGYDFKGWSDGKKTYNVGDSYTVKQSDVKFTAQWSAIPFYTVTYDTNGGSGEAPVQDKVLEGTMIRIAIYEGTKKSYTFGGWNDGQTTYAEGDIYTVKNNVRFTAVWNEIPTNVVKYDVDGGSEPKNSQLIQQWTTFFLEDYNGTKDGYTFGGWSDGKAVYQPGDKYKMGDSDLSFKAVWISNEPTTNNSSLIYIVLLAIAVIVILFLVLRVLPRH